MDRDDRARDARGIQPAAHALTRGAISPCPRYRSPRRKNEPRPRGGVFV
jgi:hypothetical protein